jgi:hypothetical protein
MLFIKHIATLTFTFLVFLYTVLAIPPKVKPDDIKAGKVYRALPKHTEPKVGHWVMCSLSHSGE